MRPSIREQRRTAHQSSWRIDRLNVAIAAEGQGIGFAIPVKQVGEALSEIFTPETD